MFAVITGDIANKGLLVSNNIDAVVNAAKPSLMGSDCGVDGAIHKAVNECLEPGHRTFAEKICEELKTEVGMNQVRCERGKAVTTLGYGLCKHIIHVVGIPYDGEGKRMKGCSSSRVRILESCYGEIVNQLKIHIDIKSVAVPIIGAGTYKFPFELASRIAVVAMGNALVDWRKENPEQFELAGIEKIYFYVYDQDKSKQQQYYQYAEGVLKKYSALFKEGRRAVYQFSPVAHMQYLNEIRRYDGMRGYFSIAKKFRLSLMWLRVPLLLPMILKDVMGGDDWEKRRAAVEKIAFWKMLLPLLFCCINFCLDSGFVYKTTAIMVFTGLVIYCMSDTITYLLTLIMLADIQKPSANIIRSMIMLFVNYVEVSFELAFLYYAAYDGLVTLGASLAFGLLGLDITNIPIVNGMDYAFLYLNAGTKFFFASLVFGYLANHMRQRKFRS